MFTLTVGNNTLKRYKLQWYSYNGYMQYVKKTRILHSASLQDAKQKAKKLYGSMPDSIMRI